MNLESYCTSDCDYNDPNFNLSEVEDYCYMCLEDGSCYWTDVIDGDGLSKTFKPQPVSIHLSFKI